MDEGCNEPYDELVEKVQTLINLPEGIVDEMSDRELNERDAIVNKLLFEITMRDSEFERFLLDNSESSNQ